MANIHGYNGQVDFGVIVDSDMAYRTSSWSLDLTCDTHDVTDFTSTGWRNHVRGLKGWTGTLELFVDTTKKIQPSDVGASATVRLYISDTTEGLTGTAICTGWHPSVNVGDVQTQTLDFQGTSDVAYF